MSGLHIRPRPLTSPALRILLATPPAEGRHGRVRRIATALPRELLATLLAAVTTGVIVTTGSWAATRLVFRSAWGSAIVTPGTSPREVLAVALVNAAVGIVAILLYRVLARALTPTD